MSKKIIQIIIMLVLLLASFAGTGSASAWSGCGNTVTVQWGDTLSGIAAQCGTSMYAIQLANPGLGYWVYAGQVLIMPGGSWQDGNSGETIHIVARGDTLKKIAARYGTSMYEIANFNGLYNYNLIFVGQRLRIPGGSYQPPAPPPAPSGCDYVIQRGDTLRKLAYRWEVRLNDILAVNPQISNASVIYAGQCIAKPGGSSGSASNYYTVQRGDTLRIIANRYGTTVYNLQLLNPNIWNPNFIYAGMVIRVK
ncbi:MAG TPA: LysM peptidoglycan-binding domain-containing protein [Anaerolineales bacterium]|jgi:LysM repeat protein